MTARMLLKSCAMPPASWPDRFHLLRLPQLLLEQLALGDVIDDRDARPLAPEEERVRGHLDLDAGAVALFWTAA